jgi:DNA-directed RNA polymerase sigma subunit (sigma70/sigma32)
MNTTVVQVENIAQLIQKTYSLDEPIGEEHEDTLASVVEDVNAIMPDETIHESQKKQRLFMWVSELNILDRKLIEGAYGLKGDEPKSHEQLAKEYKLSRQRVGQLLEAALNKLRVITTRKAKQNPARSLIQRQRY